MLNYLKRQFEISKASDQGRRFDMNSLVTTWRDYLIECDQLGYNLTNDSIYYPPDLIKQHNRTMKLIKIKADELSRKKAAVRVEKLNWMAFYKDDLFIRPAESVNELANEGKQLSHCVASYADRYINGNTAIFFIRKTDNPDASYFTLELDEKDFSVWQNRGKCNCDPPEEVRAFVEMWLEWLPIEQKRLNSLKRKELKTA